MRVLASGCIAIQPCYARVWEMLVNLFLNALCADSESLNTHTSASRTNGWGRTPVVAMVTPEAIPRGVEGQ